MAQAEFSVHLGGGLYMDSKGVLSRGPEPGKPVYATPGGGLPVPVDAVAKAFEGLAKALPDSEDPESREKFDKVFAGIGMSWSDRENLIDLLQAAGGVASVIGSVVPVVGAALAVLTMLIGLFKEGPSALELLITRRFDELESKIGALEAQIRQRDLRSQRSAIATALAVIANYLEELKNAPPDEATLLLRRQDVRNQVSIAGTAVRNLLDSSTWLTSFNGPEYAHVWPWIAHRLFTFPSAGGPQPALVPPQGANCFDHRLMVPLAIYGVTAYLTLLRASAPEFRSTRQNREDLRDFADALQVLAENMRREGLARTVYTAADFAMPGGFGPEEVIDPSSSIRTSLRGTRVSPWGRSTFALTTMHISRPSSARAPSSFPGRRMRSRDCSTSAGFHRRNWRGMKNLFHRSGGSRPINGQARTRYRITNPEECARAANAQAEQNYVDLLYSSGYLNLIHLVATLRNEATDPDRSQTVRSDAWLRRKAGPSASVTVESRPMILTGEVISAAAERAPYQYKATTWFTTQPLGRERKLRYRIWLRTLSPSSLGRAWIDDQEYGSYHRVGYTADPLHPAFQQLFTSTGIALDEFKIDEGTSGPESREKSGTAVLTAMTFDWWIPVKPLAPARRIADALLKDASLRGAGWERGPIAPPPPGGAGPSLRPPPAATSAISAAVLEDLEVFDLIGWEDGTAPSKGTAPAGDIEPGRTRVHPSMAGRQDDGLAREQSARGSQLCGLRRR